MVQDLRFHELTDILRQRRRLIVTLSLLGMALTGAAGLLLPPRYTAKAQIVLDQQQRASIPGAIINTTADEAAIPTEVATLLSHDHLEKVVKNLAGDAEYHAAIAQAEHEHAAASDAIWQAAVAWVPPSWQDAVEPALALLRPAAPAETGAKAEVKAEDSAAHAMSNDPAVPTREDLERHLKVFQEAGSHVIAVTYVATSPEQAAVVANRVTELYVQSQSDQKVTYATRERTWLGERIPVLRTELEQADAAVQAYQASHGMADTNQSTVNDQQLADLNRQLVTAESELAARQARLAAARQLRAHGSAASLGGDLNAPALIELHRQEQALLQSEAELAATYGDTYPKLQQVHRKLQDLRQSAGREFDRARGNLENDVQVASAQVQSLRQRLVPLHGASTDTRLHELEREAAAKQQIYRTAVQHHEELHEQQDTLRPDVRVMSRASPPLRPSSPNPLLFLFPALIVSGIGGSLLAVFLDRLDRKIRTERDVGDALGIPCLGLVPQLRRVGRTRPHQYLLAKPLAAYPEAIRAIVAALQLLAPFRAPKVVLISSSVPGEGKTTLAVSLAAYVASLGRKVLLVDLDFRHSTILRELGGKAEVGVLDLLQYNRPPAEIIQRLPALQLDYLPVCRRPADPFALFASQQMSRLLDKLRDEYDCVIVDGPPLLAITEARLLAAMVDRVLFVVKWGSTRKDVAQNALNLLRSPTMRQPGGLDQGRVNIAGAVVTQVDLKKHARGHHGDVAESFVRYKQYYLENAPN